MSGISPDFSALLRRLGVKDFDSVLRLLAEQVQPVMEVLPGAASLSPPVLPPVALVGGNVTGTGTAATFAHFAIHSRGPGGCFVRAVRVGATNSVTLRVSLAAANPILSGSVTCQSFNMGPQPLRSVGLLGLGNQVSTGDVPELAVVTGDQAAVEDLIYLPNGTFLDFHPNNNTTTLRALAVVQDVPVAILPDRT